MGFFSFFASMAPTLLTGSTTSSGNPLLEAVTAAIAVVLGWLGEILTAMVSSTGALYVLLPLLAVGIVISLVMLTIKIVRSFSWGA